MHLLKILAIKLKSKNWADNSHTANTISATIKIGDDYSFTTEYSSNVADYIANKNNASVLSRMIWNLLKGELG